MIACIIIVGLGLARYDTRIYEGGKMIKNNKLKQWVYRFDYSNEAYAFLVRVTNRVWEFMKGGK